VAKWRKILFAREIIENENGENGEIRRQARENISEESGEENLAA